MKPSRVALGRWTATLWLALPLALLPCASTAGAPAMDAAPQQGGAVHGRLGDGAAGDCWFKMVAEEERWTWHLEVEAGGHGA